MENLLPLSTLKTGQNAVIVSFREENEVSARLEEMGLTRGECVTVVRFAPLGDPIEVKVRGYLLSIRLEEARQIDVTLTGNQN